MCFRRKTTTLCKTVWQKTQCLWERWRGVHSQTPTSDTQNGKNQVTAIPLIHVTWWRNTESYNEHSTLHCRSLEAGSCTWSPEVVRLMSNCDRAENRRGCCNARERRGVAHDTGGTSRHLAGVGSGTSLLDGGSELLTQDPMLTRAPCSARLIICHLEILTNLGTRSQTLTFFFYQQIMWSVQCACVHTCMCTCFCVCGCAHTQTCVLCILREHRSARCNFLHWGQGVSSRCNYAQAASKFSLYSKFPLMYPSCWGKKCVFKTSIRVGLTVVKFSETVNHLSWSKGDRDPRGRKAAMHSL